MGELHFFHYVFQKGNMQGSVYLGRKDKNITLARIAYAKKAANMPDESVMLAVCYLGKMTPEHFREARDD